MAARLPGPVTVLNPQPGLVDQGHGVDRARTELTTQLALGDPIQITMTMLEAVVRFYTLIRVPIPLHGPHS